MSLENEQVVAPQLSEAERWEIQRDAAYNLLAAIIAQALESGQSAVPLEQLIVMLQLTSSTDALRADLEMHFPDLNVDDIIPR